MAKKRIDANDYSQTLFPEYMRETEPKSTTKTSLVLSDPFHLQWLEGIRFASHGMPIIEPYDSTLPTSLITFTEARAGYYRGVTNTGCVHFFIEDSRFTCILNDLPRYTSILASYPAVIGPDLSLKIDMPDPLKRCNSYLNKVITCYLQIHGVSTIPNVVWAEPRCYDYCFAGFPQDSIVAVNSMGIKGDRQSVFFWRKGYEEMINRLHPTHILRYGDKMEGEIESISTYFPNNHLNRIRHGR